MSVREFFLVNMVLAVVTHLLVPVALGVAGALCLAADGALALVAPPAEADRLVVRHLALRVGAAVRDRAGVPALFHEWMFPRVSRPDCTSAVLPDQKNPGSRKPVQNLARFGQNRVKNCQIVQGVTAL